ncbi:hypothetical protein C8Q80DRAFT_563766 [Daedaleopsis nitida]|nr:hypothetical protein C8Q80DRAFT_563766 [Daedaleopsis nitida]
MFCRACIPHVPVTRALAIPTIRLAHTFALRHFTLSVHTARSSPSHPRQPSWARSALITRSFSSTPHRRAGEDPKLQAIFENQQRVLKLLQDKPEVLDNMKEFVTLLKDNGVDVQSGQMPSKMEMFSLLMKTEVRDSAMKMAAAFKKLALICAPRT